MANASAVAGVYTGSSTSAASASAPATATTRRRAVPTWSATIGKRTSTRSLAGTVTRLPVAAEPLTVEGVRLAASGSKLDKARALGVLVWDEAELRRQVGAT